MIESNVAPYTGAWIEIYLTYRETEGSPVAPYTGAWIEIFAAAVSGSCATSRAASGFVVRWNSHVAAPYTGAWIEI